jgi:outer membrane receptor protein involved in Fe transport
MFLAALLIATGEIFAAPPEPLVDRPDEIVVTGERVKRSIRDTASSVEVATQREIEAQSADRVDQVLSLIPNVQLGNGSEGPAIRGQDTTGALQALPAFMGGNRPRTTIIVDGRRQTYNEFVFGAQPVWDLDRIEVFRSPQTTTQGQNSIAGAIFVYSNDPSFNPEFRLRAIGGNYRTGELSAAASGPISGDLAVRVSGDVRYARPTSHIVDRIEGGDPNHDFYGLGRAKLLVKPRGDPGARFELTYAHNQSEAPQVVAATAPFRKRRDEDGFLGVFRINVDSLTATVHQPLSADLVADLVVTGGDSDARRLAFHGLGQSHIQGRDWSAEAVLNWSPEGPLRAVGGASRTHLVLRQSMDLSLLSGLGHFHDDQDSVGLFGEASLTLLPGATLSAGIRYQQDRQNRTGAFVGDSAILPLDYDRTFHAWLPKLTIAYDISPVARVGAFVQRGYNPGGTTLRLDTGQPDNFEAETLWDYESFVRATIARGVGASANLFYYDMHNAQRAQGIVITGPAGFPVGFADLFNAPRAHSYGAEAELDWRANKQLSARVALGLLRTKLVDAGLEYTDFSGNESGRSPHLSAAAAVDWEATPRLRLSVQGHYHSGYFSDDSGDPLVRIQPSAVFDGRAEYRLSGFTMFVYARNLFDNFALIEQTAPPELVAVAEDPRMIGLGIDARF